MHCSAMSRTQYITLCQHTRHQARKHTQTLGNTHVGSYRCFAPTPITHEPCEAPAPSHWGVPWTLLAQEKASSKPPDQQA